MEMQTKPLNEENDYYPAPNFDNSNIQNSSNNAVDAYTNNPPMVQPYPSPNPQNINQEYYAPQISPQGYNQPQQINQPIQMQVIDYANYSNVNQINSKNIHQIDSNNIYLSLGCCFKIVPIIFFLVGLAAALSALHMVLEVI